MFGQPLGLGPGDDHNNPGWTVHVFRGGQRWDFNSGEDHNCRYRTLCCTRPSCSAGASTPARITTCGTTRLTWRRSRQRQGLSTGEDHNCTMLPLDCPQVTQRGASAPVRITTCPGPRRRVPSSSSAGAQPRRETTLSTTSRSWRRASLVIQPMS
jgi:hypothetical protein